MSNKPDVTIIIPAYNEEEGITDVINQAKHTDANYEILVVDDNSPDGTGKILDKMAKKNRGINLIW